MPVRYVFILNREAASRIISGVSSRAQDEMQPNSAGKLQHTCSKHLVIGTEMVRLFHSGPDPSAGQSCADLSMGHCR